MAISSEAPLSVDQQAAHTNENPSISKSSHSRSRSMPFSSLITKKTKDTNPALRESMENVKPASSSEEESNANAEFEEDVNTNNDLPTRETLREIENLPIMDQDGRTLPFKTVYTGPNVTRRVLVIFIRHFFCGYCQEYIRALTSSITPSTLLSLPTPTFITIIGHGSPSLIQMYADATGCPFPIYADPTKKLYSALGMVRTHYLGARPEYQVRQHWTIMGASILQSIKRLKGGLAFKGGDYQQVGGEFLFEPTNINTPLATPQEAGREKELGVNGMQGLENAEEKIVTWCHRMRNTRDHAEIAELREILGVSIEEGNESESTSRSRTRKGTGFSEFSGAGTVVGCPLISVPEK